MDKDKELIKERILSALAEMGVRAKSIILFGSQARGDSSKDSDWDFLIVLKEKVSREERIEISHMVGTRIANLGIPSDVIVRSEEEVEERKNVVGSVIRSAVKEGVSL